MDNMLNMMEKYANNLEEIVEQRTAELVEEKKKTDRLLYRLLPRFVQLQLMVVGIGEGNVSCSPLMYKLQYPKYFMARLVRQSLY